MEKSTIQERVDKIIRKLNRIEDFDGSFVLKEALRAKGYIITPKP